MNMQTNKLLLEIAPNLSLGGSLTATQALIFHESRNKLAMVTHHPVKQYGSKAPVLCAGTVLTHQQEQRILDLLNGRARVSDGDNILPAHCLLSQPDRFAYWIPSQVRLMHLAEAGRRWSVLTRWPTLVVKVDERVLSVAALASDTHPSADTVLYHAPLPNVYENTSVCTGDAPLPVDSSVASIEAWSAVLFDTAFTHPNWSDALSRSAPCQRVDELWSSRDGVLDALDPEWLVATGLNLRDWLGGDQ